MTNHVCAMPKHGREDAPHTCCRPRQIPPPRTIAARDTAGWSDGGVWTRAAHNTTHCLFGCTLGDVAAMTLVPLWWPEVSTALLMVVSILSGLISSLALETIVLRLREGFTWRRSLVIAMGMSLISMIIMEAVMNAVDWLAMGGTRMPMHQLSFWLAWIPALIVGFLAALPYNYVMLRQHGRSCH